MAGWVDGYLAYHGLQDERKKTRLLDLISQRNFEAQQEKEAYQRQKDARQFEFDQSKFQQDIFNDQLNAQDKLLGMEKTRKELTAGPKGEWSDEVGGFIYAPDEKNPQGRVVKVAGVTPKPKAPFAIPSGYDLSPDGKSLVAIKGGPADEEAIAQKKPPTDENSKAYGFALRTLNSDSLLRSAGDYSPTALKLKKWYQELPSPLGGVSEGVTNMMMSESTMSAEQAQRDFINAILRRESGAVINDEEFENARQQYFPQPGESDTLAKQKALTRKLAMEGLRASSGKLAAKLPSYEELQATPPVNTKGWLLMIDGNGSKAYVGPNGEIEEVK